MQSNPLHRLLAKVTDAGFVRGRTFKAVAAVLQRSIPRAGRGLTLREAPDGTFLDAHGAAGAAGVGFGFRVRVEEGLVLVDPGFWDFCGQPTFPGWPGGGMFGQSAPPALISVGGGERWQFYLHAEHDDWGVLTGTPTGLQYAGASGLANDLNNTYLLVARANVNGGAFDEVMQIAGGSITTLMARQTYWSGTSFNLAGHVRAHYSY